MKKNGFTLVEILAVIGILAILAVITYPIIDDIIVGSRENTFKASVEELINAAEVDYTENGRTGTVVYNLTNNNSFACTGCSSVDYQGEIKNGTGKVVLTDGKASTVDISSDLYKAALENGKIIITEK